MKLYTAVALVIIDISLTVVLIVGGLNVVNGRDVAVGIALICASCLPVIFLFCSLKRVRIVQVVRIWTYSLSTAVFVIAGAVTHGWYSIYAGAFLGAAALLELLRIRAAS